MDNLWLKVENIVSKGEIARFVTAFNNFSVISPEPVSRNANPTTLSAKEGRFYCHFQSLWYDPVFEGRSSVCTKKNEVKYNY